MIKVRTQAELDRALKNRNPGEIVSCVGNGHFAAHGSSQVTASPYVAVTKAAGGSPKISGGVIIEIPLIDTAEKWCDYYGIEVKRGLATLFKALDDDYSTSPARSAGIFYTPDSEPSAPDWDGGDIECGGGLHFSPRPFMGLKFNPDATRYVACPVKVSEIVVHPSGTYPNKVKAPRVAGKCYEVDIDGNRL